MSLLLMFKYVKYTVKAIEIVWGKTFWAGAQCVLHDTCDQPDTVDPRQSAAIFCAAQGVRGD